ncbi:MAG TPA: (2Fe-2S)-binding protein [Chloroflexota bacterium]|nr:(2Fe-2S)-binding protein [Chloroflexota bacterium]
MDKVAVSMAINGQTYDGLVEPRKLLVDFIREDAGLTGTHIGCEHGVCGACTILLDGETIRSCLTFAVQAQGKQLWTVESLAENGKLSPLQNAFWENHGLQCGFCTPGILMTAVELLRDNSSPDDREIREGISGNLCRCTGYKNIVKSIAAAADKYKAGEKEPVVAKVWGR